MRPDLLPTDVGGKVAKVTEECGEVLQAIGKLQRFGPTATDPKTQIWYDNIADLKTELDDLIQAATTLQAAI